MNQKDNELYKAGQFTEWQKSVEEEIRNLNKKLDIVLFLSVWNDFEKILNNNSELKDCELIISGALKENAYEEEYLHTIVEITQNNQVILNKNILKEIEVMFEYKLCCQLPDDEFKITIKLNQSKAEIREELAKIFLNEENKITYNYFLINYEIENKEITNISARRNKL